MTAPSAPPQLSPDGHWWWTGTEWVLARELFAPTPAQHVVPTQQSVPTQQLPVFEILPASAALPEPAKRSWLTSTVAGAAATVVLLGAGAFYGVGHYLGGGGQQPEDVLPGNAAAVVKLDLDPSLSQKAALFRLSRAIPQLKATSQDSLRDDLLRGVFTSSGLDYDRSVKPWLGDRAAVAAVPDASPGGFAAVVAVQYTDRDKAKRALQSASAAGASAGNPMFFAFSGDYALLAETQAAADSAASADTHLADNAAFNDAVDSLDGDQIAVAWADLSRVYDALPAELRMANPLFGNVQSAPTGSFVVGVHAASDYLEVEGRGIDLTEGLAQAGAAALGKGRTAGLIASFPNDTVAALEVTGLGDVVTKAFTSLPPSVTDAVAGLGLTLPGDLAHILGTNTAVALTGDITDPTVVANVRTANPAKATAALKKLSRALGNDAPWGATALTVRPVKGGYVLTTDRTAKTTGKLDSTPSFTRAVPDAKSAGMVLYVNLTQLPAGFTAAAPGLDAVGMTADAQGNFRLRLTTR